MLESKNLILVKISFTLKKVKLPKISPKKSPKEAFKSYFVYRLALTTGPSSFSTKQQQLCSWDVQSLQAANSSLGIPSTVKW